MKRNNATADCSLDGGICRPGGLALTQRLLALGGLSAGAAVVDIGCGSGVTVRWLLQQGYTGSAGVDSALPADVPPPLYRAEAQQLPFETAQFDAVLCECSLSLLEQATIAMKEFDRVLKPGGLLLASDLYSRTVTARLSGEANRLYTRDDLYELLATNGFTVSYFEDQSDTLKQLAIQRILDDGADALYSGLGTSFEEMKRIRPGYCLLVAHRATAPAG